MLQQLAAMARHAAYPCTQLQGAGTMQRVCRNHRGVHTHAHCCIGWGATEEDAHTHVHCYIGRPATEEDAHTQAHCCIGWREPEKGVEGMDPVGVCAAAAAAAAAAALPGMGGGGPISRECP